MRLAFMGTPEFSVPVLNELAAAGHEIAAVYTRAPQPSGRGKKLTKSPVHQFAAHCGFEVRTPENFNLAADREAFDLSDVDVAIVVAYGVILPQKILDMPRHGCLNLHASLLPRWRGAAPIQRAIMAGDAVTGVQVMRMEAGLDTGAVLLSETTEIKANDTAGALHDRLSRIGAQLAPRALAALARGDLVETPQSDDGVTYAHKITARDARIDWTRPAAQIDCHIRGLSPFPGAWFTPGDDAMRIKALLSAQTSMQASGGGAPGQILDADKKLIIACGAGAVELVTLQRAGKQAQSAEEFLRGFALHPGAQVS